MKRLIALAASVGLAGAFLIPAASVATAAETTTVGTTAIRVNAGVTEALLRSNITVNAQDPGGSTILPPGKLAMSFPVSGVKNGKASHLGSLFLSHTGSMGWRTVVVDNLTVNLKAGTLKGRVYATDTDLGTYTIFTLTNVQTASDGSTSFTVKLAPGVAGLLNAGLGTHAFGDKMRIGSGVFFLLP